MKHDSGTTTPHLESGKILDQLLMCRSHNDLNRRRTRSERDGATEHMSTEENTRSDDTREQVAQATQIARILTGSVVSAVALIGIAVTSLTQFILVVFLTVILGAGVYLLAGVLRHD